VGGGDNIEIDLRGEKFREGWVEANQWLSKDDVLTFEMQTA